MHKGCSSLLRAGIRNHTLDIHVHVKKNTTCNTQEASTWTKGLCLAELQLARSHLGCELAAFMFCMLTNRAMCSAEEQQVTVQSSRNVCKICKQTTKQEPMHDR